MISSGLRVQLHLPPLDLAWNPEEHVALAEFMYLVFTRMLVRVTVGDSGLYLCYVLRISSAD